MSKFAIFFTLFACIILSDTKTEWDTIYTQATYALNHSKKALSSNNFDHQKMYSEKALKAYEKIAVLLQGYEDEEFQLKIIETISDLEHAVDAPDWDRGRFYTKRVYQKTQDLITVLDQRSAEIAKIDQKEMPIPNN